MLNFTVKSWLFDDSQLPPGFVEPFRNIQDAVLLARKIREAVNPSELGLEEHVFEKTLKTKLDATTQDLVAALNKAGASVGPLLPRLPMARRALTYVEAVVNYLRNMQNTGTSWNLPLGPDWDKLLLDCFHEVHRVAEPIGTNPPQQNGLQILPGGIECSNANGKKVMVDLSGKRLACICAFLDAYQNRLDWKTLRDRVWGKEYPTEQNTIKNTVSDARDKLRELARKSGRRVSKDYNPLRCINQGKDLAWELIF